MTNINYSRLVPIIHMAGEDDEESEQYRTLHKRAVAFIESFSWSGKIQNVFFGFGVGDLIAVFLFELTPSSPAIDNLLWVIVGDVPSAYLVTDNASDPAEALVIYVNEMRKWVHAVEVGDSIEACIPVNAAPTLANAASLRIRLNFIETDILPEYRTAP